MNYRKHYDLLIERAKNRRLEGYSERHHVIPRCMGGSNKKWNIVRLTAEEHFVAHELLVKIYPQNLHLASALVKMAHRCNNRKIYGWIRRRHAAAASKCMKGNKWWLAMLEEEMAR